MKIIDWYAKGNVVRFYLGKDDLKYWGGDDWNDRPYEHNAGGVLCYDGIIDVAFGFDVSMIQAHKDYHYKGNSPYSKDDFKERKAPILIIDTTGEQRYYSIALGDPNCIKIYMGDRVEDIDWKKLHALVIYSENCEIIN